MRKDLRSDREDPSGNRNAMRAKKWWTGLLAGVMLLAAGCGNETKEIYRQANEDLENGLYEDAASEYSQVIGQGEAYLAESYRGLGIARYESGDYLDASSAFASALEQEETGSGFRRDVLLYQAASCYRQGMYEKAAEACREALDLEASMDGWFLLGKICLEQDLYEEAKDAFDEAYETEASYEMAIQIYQAYVERSMEADGTAYLNRALEAAGSSVEDNCKKGRIYYYMRDYEKAAEVLTEAVNKDSDEAKLLLGDVYLAQGDTANARMMYQECIDLEEKAAKGYNGLALCDLAEEDYVSALDNIEKGLRAAQEEEIQGLLFNEAVIYEKQGNYQEALDKFETYRNLYPDDEEAQREYAFLQSRTGNTAAAETSAGEEDAAAESGWENEDGQ